MPRDQAGDVLMERAQSLGEGALRVEADPAALDQPGHPGWPVPCGAAVPGLDHTVAGDRRARVDAQDLHVTPSPPPAPRRRYRSWTTPWRRRPSLRAPRSARATA